MSAEPPLLMIAAGRKPRVRRAPKMAGSELHLHFATVDLLRKVGRLDWRWTHIASGEERDPRVGAKLKAMGLMPGWPDIIMVSPAGRFFGLELKAPGGELSGPQQSFRMWAIRYGISYSVARSLDEVLTIFKGWGCLTIGGAK